MRNIFPIARQKFCYQSPLPAREVSPCEPSSHISALSPTVIAVALSASKCQAANTPDVTINVSGIATGDDFSGKGKLNASGVPKIDINNNSSAYLVTLTFLQILFKIILSTCEGKWLGSRMRVGDYVT